MENTLPGELKIISKALDDGEIMAVKHKDYDVYGLQFHPESILTPDGLTIIKNFIDNIGGV
jgi:anthranilate synthase component 2